MTEEHHLLELLRAQADAIRMQTELIRVMQADCAATRAVLKTILVTHPEPAKALNCLLFEMDAYADMVSAAGESPAAMATAVAQYRDLLSLCASKARRN